MTTTKNETRICSAIAFDFDCDAKMFVCWLKGANNRIDYGCPEFVKRDENAFGVEIVFEHEHSNRFAEGVAVGLKLAAMNRPQSMKKRLQNEKR